jgi:hypothetical protein
VESQINKLLTKEALSLLREIGPLDGSADVLKLITTLRKAGHDPELVTTVVNQARLRHRAIAKFGDFANDLLFTEAGLEQATRLPVAALHAQRFRDSNIKSVTDLGCGIAADSMTFAALGIQVTAVEQDSDTAALASFNLASFPDADVLNMNAEEAPIRSEALFFDPARRDLSRKGKTHTRLNPEDFSPNLDWVFEMAKKYPTGVKLSPAFDHDLIPEEAEAIWVSHNGDLVEVLLWFGALASKGQRSALLLKDGQRFEFAADPSITALVDRPKKYIFEPDNALIRSHLMGEFANQNGLTLLAPSIAYLSAEERIESPWVKTYEVVEQLPLDIKILRKALAAREIGELEIKKRGIDLTPEELRPQLKLKGKNAATLILTKVDGVRAAFICYNLNR